MARDRACVCLCAECIGKSICWGNKYCRTENALKCQKEQLQFLYVSYVGEPKTHWQRESVFVWSIDASKQKKREKECWLYEKVNNQQQQNMLQRPNRRAYVWEIVRIIENMLFHGVSFFFNPFDFYFIAGMRVTFEKEKNNEWKVKYCLVSTYCWWCIWLH